jgi:hypothetical protein
VPLPVRQNERYWSLHIVLVLMLGADAQGKSSARKRLWGASTLATVALFEEIRTLNDEESS